MIDLLFNPYFLILFCLVLGLGFYKLGKADKRQKPSLNNYQVASVIFLILGLVILFDELFYAFLTSFVY